MSWELIKHAEQAATDGCSLHVSLDFDYFLLHVFLSDPRSIVIDYQSADKISFNFDLKSSHFSCSFHFVVRVLWTSFIIVNQTSTQLREKKKHFRSNHVKSEHNCCFFWYPHSIFCNYLTQLFFQLMFT